MCFHNKAHQDDCELKIDGLEVSRVQVTKFLAVLVDEKLLWSNRINVVCKMSRKIFLLFIKSNTCLKTTSYTCYIVH